MTWTTDTGIDLSMFAGSLGKIWLFTVAMFAICFGLWLLFFIYTAITDPNDRPTIKEAVKCILVGLATVLAVPTGLVVVFGLMMSPQIIIAYGLAFLTDLLANGIDIEPVCYDDFGCSWPAWLQLLMGVGGLAAVIGGIVASVILWRNYQDKKEQSQ